MARFLVTGANGFIGRAVCKTLAQRDLPFTAISRSNRDVNSYLNIGDINGSTDWSEALAGVDVVIHLAAHVHVLKPNQTAEIFHQVNVDGTANLARQAAKAGARRLVFASSIKVNGEYTESQPFTESDPPRPMDAYGRSKLEAEEILWEISREAGIEIVVLRPPLVYGPGVKANFLSLIKLVSRGIWMPLGAINNKRSLIYVENLADALVLCATHPGAAGETYLVSDGPALSTPEMIRRIAIALGSPCRIFSVSPTVIRLLARLVNKSQQMNKLLQSLEVDSSKIRNQLGWVPPFTMQQGLAITAEWFRTYCWDKNK